MNAVECLAPLPSPPPPTNMFTRNVAWFALAAAVCLVTLLVIDGAHAANRTRFDHPNPGHKRTLVTAARAAVQWTVNVDCGMTWEEIQAIYFTLSDPEGPLPCWLSVAGQGSMTTILIIQCEDHSATYGTGIDHVILSESFGCGYTVTRDAVAKINTVQVVSAFWHLDRIDARSLPLNQQYVYQRTGTGVTAIVLDTGCAPHNDYNSRVTDRTNFIGSGTTSDPNGHGSHVMGLLGGTTSGVAKNATLWCWTVLDEEGYGTFSEIQLAIQELMDRQTTEPFPAVVSMSLAGSYYAPINTQLTTLINTYGVAVVVAAGNSGVDAINFSPASTAAALTICATYHSSGVEGLASYSNRGSITDMCAPGSGISGPSNTNMNTYVTKSGTSMATPVVAGVVVLAMQQRLLDNASISGALAMAAVKSMATQSKISGYPMLFTSFGAASVPQPPPPPPPPSAAPMAPPQSAWLAPLIRPVAGDSAPLMIAFLSHPLVPALLLLSCLVDW